MADSMMGFLQVTAEYSNAVLVAILPHVSDFAQKLDLPGPHPISISSVARFNCDPRSGQTGGLLILKNGAQFWYERGHVASYESTHCYFALQDPQMIPRFHGPWRMSEADAVRKAREGIGRLGYAEPRLRDAPEVTRASNDERSPVPHYLVQWFDEPRRGGSKELLARVEVNANHKRIEEIRLAGTNFSRSPPPIPVSNRVHAALPAVRRAGGMDLEPLAPPHAQALLLETVRSVNAYAKALGLPVKWPLSTNDVAAHESGVLAGSPVLQINLRDGWRFLFHHGYVNSFHAPDAFFTYEWQEQGKKFEDFVGPLTLSEPELIRLVRTEVLKLGWSGVDAYIKGQPWPQGGPDKEARHGLTRYLYAWRSDPMTSLEYKPEVESVVVEIDARTKKLKSLQVRHRSLWRNK